MLEVYREVAEDVLAIPVIRGRKSDREKFAGATSTYAIEALMPDGKALQTGTSHELGQNFARAYDITFTDVDEQVKHAWTTSWGVSWRVLGGVIMVHGDDRGLLLPPAVAPHQVVIVPIPKKGDDTVIEAARRLEAELSTTARTLLDARGEQSAPWKFNEWEMRGVPLRIEIGPRDVAAGQITIARRDTLEKIAVPREEAADRVTSLLAQVQSSLLAKARADLEARSPAADGKDRFIDELRRQAGFVSASWCERGQCEEDIKNATGAVSRVIIGSAADGARCVFCDNPASVRAYFARSY